MSSASSPIRVVILPFREGEDTRLAALASQIMAPGARVPSGSSQSRILEFYAGRAALAHGLAAIGFRGVVEPDSAYGYLVTRPRGPYVNLSHTRGIAVAVVGEAPVGVDVESVDRDPSRALTRVAVESELEGLAQRRFQAEGGESAPGPVALWSAKEAVSKAVGLGIKFGMQGFVVSWVPEPPYPVSVQFKGPFSLQDPSIAFIRYTEYVIALCSERARLKAGLTVEVVDSLH